MLIFNIGLFIFQRNYIMKTNVIYDKETQEVIVMEMDELWVLPNSWEIAHFEDDFEPVLVNVNGRMYIKTNSFIFKQS